MARKKDSDYTKADEIRSEIAESNAGEEGTPENDELQAQANGTAVKARKKKKGPRTVFYMAVVTDTSNGRATEVARADTRNQLDKKLNILVEAGYASEGIWEILQCRSL